MAADGGLAGDAVGGAALGAVLLAGRAALGAAIAADLADLPSSVVDWWAVDCGLVDCGLQQRRRPCAERPSWRA